MRSALLVALLTTLTACGTSPAPIDGGSLDAHVPTPLLRDAGPAPCPWEGPIDAQAPFLDLDLCADGIVPMGFGLRWQRTSQRLARFGMLLDLGADHAPTGCAPSALSRGATLVVEASGGVVADAPDPAVAIFDYQVVGAAADGTSDAGAPRMRFARGSATIDLLDGDSEGVGVALVDLGTAGLAGATDVALVIEGFDLTTDVPQTSTYPSEWDPARGYASRGIGVALDPPTRTGDTLSVRVNVRFEAGTLDRPDWEPGHDRATAVARTRAFVRVLAIATDVPPVLGTIAYSTLTAQPAPLAYTEPCHVPADDTALVIDGAPSMDRAVVGLTRFDVALWPDRERVGDQLRELSVRIRDVVHDPATGRASMHVDAYASNAGVFPARGMDARFEADVTLAQWSGGGEVQALTLVAPAPVGRSEVDLPMR